MTKWCVPVDVLETNGHQVFLVEADSAEEAVARFNARVEGMDIIETELEVTDLARSADVEAVYPYEPPAPVAFTQDERDLIRGFVAACFDAEGDIEDTGYVWDLSDVKKFMNRYLREGKNRE